MSTQPPVREVGFVNPSDPLPGGVGALLQWDDIEDREHVPELKWPNNLKVYSKMRADPQIDALLRGMVAPIGRFRWEIDPAGAKKGVANKLAEDLGIPILGQKKRSRKPRDRGFKHKEHLRVTLMNSLSYGHMFYEMVGEIRGGLWRLTKLGPRFPHTIEAIRVARDGGLEWIKQSGEYKSPKIPISRLVAFPFDREGGNWFGRSLLRSAYQPWLLKDRLLRIDVIRHERNGMGVPFVEMPERATPKQQEAAERLAQQYRVGAASGGAVPYGMRIRLVGVEGTVSDVLASIRYHDEAMARLMLQMFSQLGGGGQKGSTSLGETFLQVLAKAQDTVADWYIEIMNDHLIMDWVEWNYGEDEPCPQMIYKRDEDPELSAHELSQMVAMGAISVDDALEEFLRDRYGLPQRSGPSIRKKQPQPKTNESDTDTHEFPPDEGESNENVDEPPPNRPGSVQDD